MIKKVAQLLKSPAICSVLFIVLTLANATYWAFVRPDNGHPPFSYENAYSNRLVLFCLTEITPLSLLALILLLPLQLLFTYLILTTLNAWAWFTADFQRFCPPCTGPVYERLYLFSETQAGPLAVMSLPGDNVWTGIIAATVIIGLMACARAFDNKWTKGLAHVAIVIWFFLGAAVTCLRVT